MKIYQTALLVNLFLLSSCATQPTETFADFADQFEKTEIPERVIYDFKPACNDKGDCLVKEKALERGAAIISRLNDTVESLTKSDNSKLDSIIHLEFANKKLREAINHLEISNSKCEFISAGKQIVLSGICALLLGL